MSQIMFSFWMCSENQELDISSNTVDTYFRN